MADNDGQTNSENENTTTTTIHIGSDTGQLGIGTPGSDIIDSGGGNDVVFETGGTNIIDTGSGEDYTANVSSGSGWDIVMGGSGNDSIIGPRFGFLNARGGTGNDTIIGGLNTDYLFGDEGDDLLLGGGGNDVLVGGEGNDWLHGGSGDDRFVYGQGDGNDLILDFGSGNDVLDLTPMGGTITWEELQKAMSSDENGNTQIDLTQWGGGTITLYNVDQSTLTEDMFDLPTGEAATDPSAVFQDPDVNSVYLGSSGDDVIDLSDSDSAVYVTGGEGSDTITGGSSGDVLKGGEGDDKLTGNAGIDLLMGGEGDDTLIGGDGADILIGGEGVDILTGGAGADDFVFATGHGNDQITDFTFDEDKINLSVFNEITSFDQLSLTQDGTDVVLDLSSHGGGVITLQNVTLSNLDADDFTLYNPPPASADSTDGL